MKKQESKDKYTHTSQTTKEIENLSVFCIHCTLYILLQLPMKHNVEHSTGNSTFKNLNTTLFSLLPRNPMKEHAELCSYSPNPSTAFLEFNSLSFLHLFYLTFYFLVLSLSHPTFSLHRYMFLNSSLHLDFLNLHCLSCRGNIRGFYSGSHLCVSMILMKFFYPFINRSR